MSSDPSTPDAYSRSADTSSGRALTPYHRRLPWGERLAAEPLLGGPFFPFEDPVVRPLEDPVVPEPPRNGGPGGTPCFRCANPDAFLVWRDDLWQLTGGFSRIGLPAVVCLMPREHVRLDTLTEPLLTTMGSMIQRIAGAVQSLDGVARTHFNRWGDGSEHFHMWFLARPTGMMQLRGAGIAFWDEMLPDLPADEHAANLRVIAAVLAEDGGEAFEPTISPVGGQQPSDGRQQPSDGRQ
jgi:hypothetical protein